MRKKKILLLFWSIVLILAVATGAILIKYQSRTWSKKVTFKDYGLELNIPRAYVEIEKEDTDIKVDELSSKITATIPDLTPDEDDVLFTFVKELMNAKSNLSGISILIEGLKTEKTTKSIEEICNNYITMFKVFNESQTIVETKIDEVLIDGNPAGKTEIYVQGSKEDVYPGMISYLISLDDREITIAFTGTKRLFEKNKKEIESIVNSIKLKDGKHND